MPCQYGADRGNHDETDDVLAYSLLSLVVMLHIYTCHGNNAVKAGDGCGFAVMSLSMALCVCGVGVLFVLALNGVVLTQRRRPCH